MSSGPEVVIELLPGADVWVRVHATVTHLCPVDGSVDADRVTIRYHAGLGTIEAGSLERYFDLFEPMAVSIEQLVVMMCSDLLSVGVQAEVYASGEHGDDDRCLLEVSTYPPPLA